MSRASMSVHGRHPSWNQRGAELTEHAFKKMLRSDAAIKQKFRCIYCNDRMEREAVTAEHALPASKGGATDRKNIKGCCRPCNRAKGNGSEAWFRRALNGPSIPLGDPAVTAAYIRFRLNRAVDRVEKKIRAYVGMPKP